MREFLGFGNLDRVKNRQWIILISLIILLFLGCKYRPLFLPDPEIKKVEYYPKYFCSGETIFINVEGKNIDKYVLKKRDGSTLLEINGSSGGGITPPMENDWLPLRVKVFTFAGDKTISLKDSIINIDNETWTHQYISDDELTQGNFILDSIGYVTEWDIETNDYIDVNLYDVYLTFTGFVWNIPLLDFGDRAILLEVLNDGDQSLNFRLPGGNRNLPSGQSASLPGNIRPGRRIVAFYPTPQIRLIGKLTGEYSKLEEDNLELFENYKKKYPIKLKVICQNAPPN